MTDTTQKAKIGTYIRHEPAIGANGPYGIVIHYTDRDGVAKTGKIMNAVVQQNQAVGQVLQQLQPGSFIKMPLVQVAGTNYFNVTGLELLTELPAKKPFTGFGGGFNGNSKNNEGQRNGMITKAAIDINTASGRPFTDQALQESALLAFRLSQYVENLTKTTPVVTNVTTQTGDAPAVGTTQNYYVPQQQTY